MVSMRVMGWSLGAFIVIGACGGKVDQDSASGAAGASDSFPVIGGRCLGANDEVVRDACLRTAVPGFAPRRWAPPVPRPGACLAAQIDAFAQAGIYVNSKGDAACTAFQSTPGNEACAACLVTPDTAASFGPFISHADGTLLEANLGGCVALALGDGSAGGCGARYQSLLQCTSAACAPCAGTPNDLRSSGCLCETAAQGGACATYVEHAACMTPLLQAGNADVAGCLDSYVAARYFCLAH